jgi:hypothetical protein
MIVTPLKGCGPRAGGLVVGVHDVPGTVWLRVELSPRRAPSLSSSSAGSFPTWRRT